MIMAPVCFKFEKRKKKKKTKDNTNWIKTLSRFDPSMKVFHLVVTIIFCPGVPRNEQITGPR